jgi:hypothetical protein
MWAIFSDSRYYLNLIGGESGKDDCELSGPNILSLYKSLAPRAPDLVTESSVTGQKPSVDRGALLTICWYN